MALADIIIADGQSTPVNHTFAYIGMVNNRVVRADLSQNPETPLTLTTAHSEYNKSGVKGKSHLQRFDKTLMDSDGVTPHVSNIRLMADVDNAVLSDALADDLAAFIRNWATAANVRLWLKGSVG